MSDAPPTDAQEPQSWFSCRIRFAHLSTDSETLLLRTSAYLVRAADYESALPRALEIGRREEKAYPNASGGTARIAVVEIETIDMLEELTDGTEVASLWSDDITPSPWDWDHRFRPENSRPGSSL
ncbi:DUF4288 domain-containing protein [Kitasatospora sp. NPDC057015]|uniref:DUF4288 domain-containing protein n=1 Tax=Kitasatospora sp. NPDC057015 TaxID=3346001 RepID=UPI003643E611